MTTGPRWRTEGQVQLETVNSPVRTFSNGTSTTGGAMGRFVSGQMRQCFDVVTPNFRERSAKGEIINNPFRKVTQTFTGGGSGMKTARNDNPPASPVVETSADWLSSQGHYDPKFRFNLVVDADGRLTTLPYRVDVDRLRTLAHTKALSTAAASTNETLVTLGEVRETVALLNNPLKGMDSLVQRFHNNLRGSRTLQQSLKKFKGDKVASLNDLSSQYLAWYYGMRPLVNEVDNILQAIAKPVLSRRNTARSTAGDSWSSTTTAVLGGLSKYNNSYLESEEVTVRVGILHDAFIDNQAIWGLRLSDVPSAVWNLTPYSFLLDYVANVNDFINALSPRSDIRYLAAWETVKVKQVSKAWTTSSAYTGAAPYYMVRSGNEWAQRTIEATFRSPTAVYDHIGLVWNPRPADLAKTTAIIALIQQRLCRPAGLQPPKPSRVTRAPVSYWPPNASTS